MQHATGVARSCVQVRVCCVCVWGGGGGGQLTLMGVMSSQMAMIMSMLNAAEPTMVPGPRSPALKSFPITYARTCREASVVRAGLCSNGVAHVSDTDTHTEGGTRGRGMSASSVRRRQIHTRCGACGGGKEENAVSVPR
jgi:hypothetical protein